MCLEHFEEVVDLHKGEERVSVLVPSEGLYYVPKVILSDRNLKIIFEKDKLIEGLDYIFDDLTMPLDKESITRQLYFTDLLFLPIESADFKQSDRVIQLLTVVRNARTKVIVIAKEPLLCESIYRHKLSRQALNRLSKLEVPVLVIPPESLKQDKNTNNLVIEFIRNIVDAITKTGLPCGEASEIESIISMSGRAMIGTASGTGENRLMEATLDALTSPSFDLDTLENAQGVLMIFTCSDLEIHEFDEMATILQDIKNTCNFSNFNAFAFNVIRKNIGELMMVSIIKTGLK